MTILKPNSQVPRTDPQQVFVYGTLKKGFGNHDRHLRNAKFLGQAQIEGIMFHLGSFPAINLGDKYTRILGEVYQCSWEDILSMDQLEGVDSGFYQRIEIAVFPYKKAWTYVFTHERASLEKWIVPSGFWRGPVSPRVAWAGWGKGALVGAFQTDREKDHILVGEASSKGGFQLRKNEVKGNYELINTKTGEMLGEYKHLGDLINKDGTTKPILSLPARSSPSTTTRAAEEVKKQIYLQAAGTASNYNPPDRQTILDYPVVPYTPPQREQVYESQAARALGVKVKEA